MKDIQLGNCGKCHFFRSFSNPKNPTLGLCFLNPPSMHVILMPIQNTQMVKGQPVIQEGLAVQHVPARSQVDEKDYCQHFYPKADARIAH